MFAAAASSMRVLAVRSLRAAPLARMRLAAAAASAAKPAGGDMFCYQCEQTDNNTGCTKVGVCGKTPEVAGLQDLLVHATKGIAAYATRARALGAIDRDVDRFQTEALFATLTNVNFDPARFQTMLARAYDVKERARTLYERAAKSAGQAVEVPEGAAQWKPAQDLETQADEVGVLRRRAQIGNEDAAALAELCMYGLKGLAAYAHHAEMLGAESADVYGFVHRALDAIHAPAGVGEMLTLALDVGKHNYNVMQMLDGAHVTRFGAPTPASVRMTPVEGKCILVSGHDLNDLSHLLEQTAGKGINVYTHGEMLPAHGYPELRKHKHLAGNYGSAWQNQKFEFSDFPGPIVMTTNCLVEPLSYKGRLFTRSVTGWPGCEHIEGQDYAKVIECAQAMDGFEADDVADARSGGRAPTTTVGFGHKTVLDIADKVLGAIQRGDLRHVFFIGGCDGSEGERSYFRDLARAVPQDCVMLTAGCGKYRINGIDHGMLGSTGIPRLLDMGQCNDVYGVIQVASALAGALKTDVNSLPLSLAVSWFEQKAVAVLLTLLHLGVKNIHLGPRLPAFVTPNALAILQDKFALTKTGSAHSDLAKMLA